MAKPKETFERGVERLARPTLFAEGARGSCSESLMEHFNLREDKSEQTFALNANKLKITLEYISNSICIVS